MASETALTRPAENKLAPFRSALAKSQESFRAALPSTVAKYLTPERLTKITLSAISRSPLLLECTPESVLRSVMDAASLGLEPTGGVLGHAYLVPYRNNKTNKREAQLIVGYRGLIDLAHRSEKLIDIEAHAVHEHDYFRLEYGRDPKLEHKPKLDGPPGQLVGAYCVATLVGGRKHCEWMSLEEIIVIRDRSRARDDGPWKTDFEEMAKKTVVRRCAKYLPMSTELVRALEVEDAAETGTEPPSVVMAFPVEAPALEAANDNGDSASKRKTRGIVDKIKSASEPKAGPPSASDAPPHNAETGEVVGGEHDYGPPPFDSEPGSDG